MSSINRIVVWASVWTALLFAAITVSPESAHAQFDETGMIQYANCQGVGGFVPLECFQGSRKLTGAYYTEDLGPFMNKVFVGAISLGAILAVFRLAWAGFVYLSSDLWTNKDHAKDIIKETLLGLFLLLGIWLILYQINPDILKLKIATPPVRSAPTTPSAGLSPQAEPNEPEQQPGDDGGAINGF